MTDSEEARSTCAEPAESPPDPKAHCEPEGTKTIQWAGTALRSYGDRAAARAAIVVAFVAVVLGAGTRGYDTNDDPAMAALASGAFTGEPDARWVFVAPLHSAPVTALYRLLPNVPWYGLAFYAIHVVAISAIIDVTVRRRRAIGMLPTVISVATTFVVVPRFLLNLSFTTTAFTAALASVVLFVDLATSGGWRRQRLRGTTALVLLAAALSIREQAAVAVLLLAVPVVVATLRRPWIRMLPFATSAVMVVAVNRLAIAWFSAAPYREYLSYNAARGQIHGSRRFESTTFTPELLGRMGWSTADLRMFNWFVFDDPDRFTRASLDAALAAGQRPQFVPVGELTSEVLVRYPTLSACLAALLVLALAARRWFALAIAGMTTLIGLATSTWLASSVRFPERVALPIWFVMVVLSALGFMLAPESAVRPQRRVTGCDRRAGPVVAGAFVAIVALGWASAIGPFSTSSHNDARRRALVNQLAVVDARLEEAIVITAGAALTTEATDPLSGDHVFDRPQIIGFGWSTFSPMHERRKSRVELVDPLRAPLRTSNVLVLSPPDFRPVYEDYLAQEDERTVERPRLSPVECTSVGREICLWQVDADTPAHSRHRWDGTSMSSAVGTADIDGWAALPSRDEAGFLVFGPYAPLSAQPFELTVRYRSPASPSETVAVVDISRTTSDGRVEEAVATAAATGTTGDVRSLVIPFSGDRDSLWEFRIWWVGTEAIHVEEIVTEPAGPG